MHSSALETPPAWGAPLFKATLKSERADFRVDEHMDIAFDGAGEHLYLHLQKSGMNTDELAKLIETTYEVTSKDVGLAGMKDRHAITTQWFSVTTPKAPDCLEAALLEFNTSNKEAQLLTSLRHSKKLRHGAHVGNRFQITLRNVEPSNAQTLEQLKEAMVVRIENIVISGFPNYIGPQRFGFGGQNVVRARQWFKQPKKRTSRQQRSLWLSAARSALFNAVCALRVESGNWQNLLAGEPAMLDGSRSFFDTTETPLDELQTRLQAYDIHPSAPWWGRGRSPSRGECAEFEAQALSEFSDICQGLEKAGLSQERRAIRAMASDLTHQWIDDSTLQLNFHLSPGLFATTLLSELGVCSEPDR